MATFFPRGVRISFTFWDNGSVSSSLDSPSLYFFIFGGSAGGSATKINKPIHVHYAGQHAKRNLQQALHLNRTHMHIYHHYLRICFRSCPPHYSDCTVGAERRVDLTVMLLQHRCMRPYQSARKLRPCLKANAIILLHQPSAAMILIMWIVPLHVQDSKLTSINILRHCLSTYVPVP